MYLIQEIQDHADSLIIDAVHFLVDRFQAIDLSFGLTAALTLSDRI